MKAFTPLAIAALLLLSACEGDAETYEYAECPCAVDGGCSMYACNYRLSLHPKCEGKVNFAEVLIVTERREGTTLVPRGAVLTDKGETVVYVAAPAPAEAPQEPGATGPEGDRPREGRPEGRRPDEPQPRRTPPADQAGSGLVAERRLVSVGFTDDLHAEILSGLEVGEQVVVKGQRSLKHGTPLKVLEGAPTDTTGSGS